jgi:hypothetical protein
MISGMWMLPCRTILSSTAINFDPTNSVCVSGVPGNSSASLVGIAALAASVLPIFGRERKNRCPSAQQRKIDLS